MLRLRAVAASTAFLLLLLPSLLVAQPLADRIPADAVAYVGWQGSDALEEQYAPSHLKAVLADSNLPQFFQEFLPRLAERFEKMEDDDEANEVAKTIRVVTSLGSPMWRKPTAIYFGGIDFEEELPRLALVCDAGNEAQAMHDAAKRALEATGEDVPVRIGVHAGRFVVLTLGMDVSAPFGALLGGPQAVAPAPALANHKPFTNAMARVQKQPALAAYIDLEAVWKLVDQAITRESDDEDKQSWAKARDAMNLAGLKRFASSCGFDGQGWATQAFIDAPAPRNGVASLLNGESISDDILRAVPQTTTWMTASRLDFHKVLTNVRAAVGKADAEAQQHFDQALGMAKVFSGIDLMTDLFEPLGAEWTVYIDPINGGGGNYLGFIAVNRPDDPAKLEKALVKLETTVNNAIAGQLEDEDVMISVRQTKVGDLEVHYVSVPVVAPAWAIKDGHLYFGLFPQSVVAAAAHVAEKRLSVLENEAFTDLRNRLAQRQGATGTNSIMFADLSKTAGHSYPTFLAIAQFGIGMGDMFGLELPGMILPPLHRIQRHLSPAGAVSWTDDAGWHYRTSSPFVGSEILATEANVVLMQQATAVSILLPALNAAKERANRVKCASNMRQIAQGLLLYANDNKGKYPPDLGTLAAALKDELHWSVFGCPTVGVMDAPGRDVLADVAKYEQWVNENAHYVYLGAKLHAGAAAESIILYEHDDNHEQEGMNVVFNDGHVEWFTYDAATELIQKQDAGK
jgi:prepilin-type processing-associated H-X9-DG protein